MEEPSRGTGMQDVLQYSNHIQTIGIQEQDYGYSVTVGCKHFCIETNEKLIRLLSDYILNPEIMHKRWEQDGKTIFN